MTGLPILTLLVLVPAAGALLIAFSGRDRTAVQQQGAFMFSLVNLLLSVGLLLQFDPAQTGYQLEEKYPWIPSLGITYHVGIDGLSILLVLLTTVTTPIVLLSTWRAVEQRVKEFQISLLLMESALLGVFVSLDLVLFYVFWEAMLVPMILLIGVWGGERRIYSALKFFLYTLAGSLLMLLAILYLWSTTPTEPHTFDLPEIIRTATTSRLTQEARWWLFAAFAFSFAIKVPLFPFHTWLPDAHTEAPTAGSVVLAAVLLKMGTYGFLRFGIPLFQDAAYQDFYHLIGWLSVIGIIFGACMAFMQRDKDIKKLIAYSSVSHMGFVMLGLFMRNEYAVGGAILQMVNHGISTGMLFLLVGIVYERRHTRDIRDYGGLAKSMPIFSTFFVIATLSSIGMPGLNGFVGEFLILYGTFLEEPLWATLAATGVVLGAVYMLFLVKDFLFGPLDNPKNRDLEDCTPREICYLTPLVVLMVWIGLWPNTFLNLIAPAVKQFVQDSTF